MSEEAVTFSGGADGATCLDNVCWGGGGFKMDKETA